MDDAFTAALTPLVGLPCWGVDRVQGSMLSFEFGEPHLVVREPYVSRSQSPKVRQRSARRVIKPVGAWKLFIFCCHWRIIASGETLADDGAVHGMIETAIHILDGQKLTAFALDATICAATFSFDLGATLTTWPYEPNGDEQWSLYMPDRRVLTYRADGRYSVGPGDQEPDQEVWHSGARSVRVP